MQTFNSAGKTAALIVALGIVGPMQAMAQESDDRGWFARSWGGFSSVADTNGVISDFSGVPAGDALDVSTSGGFTAGAGVGYRYSERIGVEVAWEYRSNDSEVSFDSGPAFSEGNYASNTFFLNGYYYLETRGRWEPYLGGGIAWLQEVDIDLEGNGPEQSFSASGDVGFQLFAGSSYRISDQWLAHGELRYGSITGIDLDSETGSGKISDFDYQPVTVQLGLTYRF